MTASNHLSTRQFGRQLVASVAVASTLISGNPYAPHDAGESARDPYISATEQRGTQRLKDQRKQGTGDHQGGNIKSCDSAINCPWMQKG
jgi:hypothetical protein